MSFLWSSRNETRSEDSVAACSSTGIVIRPKEICPLQIALMASSGDLQSNALAMGGVRRGNRRASGGRPVAEESDGAPHDLRIANDPVVAEAARHDQLRTGPGPRDRLPVAQRHLGVPAVVE